MKKELCSNCKENGCDCRSCDNCEVLKKEREMEYNDELGMLLCQSCFENLPNPSEVL